MCFSDPGMSKKKRHPKAFRIDRTENSADGFELRTYSSVERHLKAAPPIPAKNNKKKYPHIYNNDEEHYPPSREYWEFPTRPYPYNEQNTKGKIWVTGPDGQPRQVRPDPGYTRTITDGHKVIQGVSYHPYGKPMEFRRAKEIYSSRCGPQR